MCRQAYHTLSSCQRQNLDFIGKTSKPLASLGLSAHDLGMAETPGDRILRLFDESGVESHAAYAELIGVGDDCMSRWVNNKNKPGSRATREMARLHHVQPGVMRAFIRDGRALRAEALIPNGAGGISFLNTFFSWCIEGDRDLSRELITALKEHMRLNG